MKKLIILLMLTCLIYCKDIPVFPETIELGNQPLSQALKSIIEKANFQYSVEPDISNMKVFSVKIEKGTVFEKFLEDFLWNYELGYFRYSATKYEIRKLTEKEIVNDRNKHSKFTFYEKYKGPRFDEETFFESGTKFTGSLKQVLGILFVNNGIPYGWGTNYERRKYELEKMDYSTMGKESMKVVLDKILGKYTLKYGIDQVGKVCLGSTDGKIRLIAKEKVLMTKVFPLSFITPGEILRQIKGVLSEDGYCEVDIGSNSIIVTDEEGVLKGIDSLLKEL